MPWLQKAGPLVSGQTCSTWYGLIPLTLQLLSVPPAALGTEGIIAFGRHWTERVQGKSLAGLNPGSSKVRNTVRAAHNQVEERRRWWPHQRSLGAFQRAFIAVLQPHFCCTRPSCALWKLSWSKQPELSFHEILTQSAACTQIRIFRKGFSFWEASTSYKIS